MREHAWSHAAQVCRFCWHAATAKANDRFSSCRRARRASRQMWGRRSTVNLVTTGGTRRAGNSWNLSCFQLRNRKNWNSQILTFFKISIPMNFGNKYQIKWAEISQLLTQDIPTNSKIDLQMKKFIPWWTKFKLENLKILSFSVFKFQCCRMLENKYSIKLAEILHDLHSKVFWGIFKFRFPNEWTDFPSGQLQTPKS